MAETKKATVKEVKDFFGMSLPEMKKEWTGESGMTEQDKEQIQTGIGNGTLTY